MISYNVPIDAQRMTIGVQGENNVRQFLFDVTEWRNLTGDIGTAEMIVQRRGDSSPYAAAITMADANTVSWIPTSADTEKAGAGRIQLMWIASGQTVKTKIFDMKVDPALDYQLPDDSLDPWASWMPDIINAAAAIQDFPGTVAEVTAEAVADWLDEHLEPTEPPVDDTLSIEGAAADAKAAGDAVAELNEALFEISIPDSTTVGKYINSLGGETTDAYFDCCDYVDVSSYVKVSFSGSLNSDKGLCFYAADKSTVILVINGNNASQYGYVNTTPPQAIDLSVPNGAMYLRFSRRNNVPVTVNDFAVTGLSFSGVYSLAKQTAEGLAAIDVNDYVRKDGTDEVTTENTEFLDTVWVNVFDGNYIDGYVVSGSGSVASGFSYQANAARYNLAIIPVKSSTKYTLIVSQPSEGLIGMVRFVSATKRLALNESFDGAIAYSFTNTVNPYHLTFTTGASDKYLYVYGPNNTTSTRPFVQLAEGELTGFTTDQYNVYYGVPNAKLQGITSSPGVVVRPVSSTAFKVLVYDTASNVWMTHTFRKIYYSDTLSYGDGLTKDVVGSNVWLAEWIQDDNGNHIMQGATNYIFNLEETGHSGHVGAGHGCCVAVYTLFFADGEPIDPTAISGDVVCSCFRMTEKVQHYLIDEENTTSSSHAIPSLDENGDPIVVATEYLDATWEINNQMNQRNRLDIVRNNTVFNQCFGGMLTGYYPYFDNILINNPEFIYNGLSGSGDNITITNKGGTSTVLSSLGGGSFDADEVTLYGDKYHVKARIIANDPSRNNKLNVISAAMPPNYDSRLKFYFMPCICTTSTAITAQGESVETFNNSAILDVMFLKKLDVSV